MQYPTIAQPQYGFAPTMPMMPSMSDMPPAMMASGGLVDAARSVQSRGRGEDTMLVHMTPGEVGGLQALAMSQGGSLSINPETGLPEAGFLKNFLPTLLGIGLTIGSGGLIDPVTAGMIVGGGTTVATGDLGQGLMAGLGAYGGATTTAALSPTAAAPGAIPTAAPGINATLPTDPSVLTSPTQIAPPVGSSVSGNALSYGPSGTQQSISGTQGISAKLNATTPAGFGPTADLYSVSAPATGSGIVPSPTTAATFGTPSAQPSFIDRFKTAAASGGEPSAIKTGLAATGAIAPFIPEPKYDAPVEEDSGYEGPYKASERRVSYPGEEDRRRSSEYMYFSPSNPIPFAEGGDVAAPSMSAPEAQVFSQIANVQRLAGLPVIDTSGFNVRSIVPSVEERMGLVYNPIDNTYTSPIGSSGTPLGAAGGAERSYGFQSLGNAAVPESGRAPSAGGGGITFYKRTTPRTLTSRYYIDPAKDPEGYREQFEAYTPTSGQQLNMSEYQYDPVLGGFVGLPSTVMWGGAEGGSVPELESGGFVLTKKAVDGLGKGDNKKGQEVASRGLGAIPIKGPGTGTSDSIKTTIDGKQPARIANGESYVPRKEVQKRGGAKKFYALMKKAERRA